MTDTALADARAYLDRLDALDDAFAEWSDPDAEHPERPCPGVCNLDWRRAHRMQQDELHRAARGGVAPVAKLVDHGLAPVLGDPWWCLGCQVSIVSAIGQMPDLAADLWDAGHEAPAQQLRIVVDRELRLVAPIQGPSLLLPNGRLLPPSAPKTDHPAGLWIEYLDCKHSVTVRLADADDPAREWPMVRRCTQCAYLTPRVGEGKLVAAEAGRRSSSFGSPSGSPAWDAIEDLVAWLGHTEDVVRGWLRHSVGPDYWVGGAEQRGHTMTRSVQYLTEWSTHWLRREGSVQIGKAALGRAKKARRAAGTDELVHRLEVRCPTCKMRSLERADGSDTVACKTCGRTWTSEEYGWLAKTTLDHEQEHRKVRA